MAVFAVSFELSTATTRLGSYQERYESFDAAIKAAAHELIWEETTSFYSFISKEISAAAIARYINEQSRFDPDYDKALVINLSQKGYATCGRIEDKDIDAIMQAR